jgi:hypothetical protein
MKAHHVPRCVGPALALLLASVRIPIVGPFFSLLTPLPFLYYSAKLGVYGLILLQQILVIGGTMAGLFDQWADFRRIYQRKPELGRGNS